MAEKRFHDVRVKKFGSFGAGAISCLAITAVGACASLPQAVANCVAERCVLDTPSTNHGSLLPITGLYFSGEVAASGVMYYHKACAARDCLLDFGDITKEFRGINANGGLGTIIEGNAVRNCKYGYYASKSAASPTLATVETKDLILRGNYFYNVVKGIHQEFVNAKWQLGRIIVQKNQIELPSGNASAVGIKLDGHSNSPSAFLQTIIRGNTIRHLDDTSHASAVGIYLNACAAANVEQNLIDIATANNAINHDSTAAVNTFNNQSSAGLFLPAYNTSTTLHDPDLVTDVEDVILGL